MEYFTSGEADMAIHDGLVRIADGMPNHSMLYVALAATIVWLVIALRSVRR